MNNNLPKTIEKYSFGLYNSLKIAEISIKNKKLIKYLLYFSDYTTLNYYCSTS